MPAPWQETQTKIVVEFQKSGQGVGRRILLKHNPEQLPYQLQGRVSPQVWHAFMTDVDQLANTHPYVVNPSAGRMFSWLGGLISGLVLGCCFINPDGGDYGPWLQQLNALVARHQQGFAPGGVHLSTQSVHGSIWIQGDVNPGVAVGVPTQLPPAAPDMKPAAPDMKQGVSV